jgi:UDP-N-acetylmuramoylalanine--D-glutamate ligase
MRVLVVGLARTGIAVAQFLSSHGALVVGTDIRERADLERNFPDLRNLSIELQVGRSCVESFPHADLIVISPGVPPEIAPLTDARRRGVPIISEIELASWFISIPLVAITGTNGKTTTTLLLGDMLRRSGRGVFVGGNIGNPLINLADDRQNSDIAVVEISSFQLEGIESFRPFMGVLLNITEDHLDRYPSFDAYVAAKTRLLTNQRPSDYTILNAGDPIVEQAGASCQARKVYFNVRDAQTEGAGFDGRHIRVRGIGESEEAYDPLKSRLMGSHNIENMMAAIVTARLCGCPRDIVQETLEKFSGLPHRLEFVAQVEGVRYVNDSKATNVGAVVRSLQAFCGPLILIAGGKDKGGDYGPLKRPIQERVKHLILIGEAKERMERELGGFTPTTLLNSLDAAVQEARSFGRAGDTVLLSPACSSYDMFRDYEERGNLFKTLVGRLVRSDDGGGASKGRG